MIALVFSAGFLIGNFSNVIDAQGGQRLPDQAEQSFEALFQAYNLVQSQYIEPPDDTTLVDGAIRGMIQALDDPYSNYVDAVSFPFVDGSLSGQIEGIGVVIEFDDELGEIVIVNVMTGTPAERAGILSGDRFYEVNGENVVGFTILELASRVRGPAGTTVDLIMQRGEERVPFTVERARIEIENVVWRILDGNIGYLSLYNFNGLARGQLDAALAEMQINTRAGLILDLRNNPGGLLTAAIQVGGMFLNNETILIEDFGDEERIFKVSGNTGVQIFPDGSQQDYINNAGNSGVTVPIVVLVNQRSASASELVAGAWQDSGSVTLIGTTTFGKGTVQLQNQLINGGGLRLTVARWYTPQRRSITGLGVTPDIIIEMPDDIEIGSPDDLQLNAAINFLLGEPVTP